MSDTELAPEVAPEIAPMKRPRRPAVAPPPAPAEPATETAGLPSQPSSTPTLAPVASDAAVAEQTAAVPEPPLGATRRGKRQGVVTVPWESNLPGVTSAKIRAELARRERRAEALLAERQRVLEQMEAIEAALDDMGEDPPAYDLGRRRRSLSPRR